MAMKSICPQMNEVKSDFNNDNDDDRTTRKVEKKPSAQDTAAVDGLHRPRTSFVGSASPQARWEREASPSRSTFFVLFPLLPLRAGRAR